MEELDTALKGALFGGYDKESVLVYIRGLAGEYREEATRLQGELDKARAVSATLNEQNRQMYSQMEKQNLHLEQKTIQMEEQRRELERYRAKEGSLASAEIEAQTVIEETRHQVELLIREARQEQERITKEAIHSRVEQVYVAEARIAEARRAAEQLWMLFGMPDAVKEEMQDDGAEADD